MSPLFSAEQRAFERRIGHALFQPAQIAALRFRAEVGGIGLRQRREILAGLGFGRDRLRFLQRRLLRRGIGIRVDLHEDVRGQALLGRDETRLLFLVALLQRVVVGLDVGLHLRRIELDIVERDLFRAS